MSSIDASMPPDAVIRAALRETTERLAGEIATPTERAPMWTDFEWRVAIAVSVMHGISGLLHSRLRWQGPAVWQGFLAEQKRQCELRQQRIATLLARLDEAGRAGQVPMLAMKGSALLALDLFGVGERPMSDIDLLVRPSDCDRMTRILHAMGYATEFEHPRHVCLRPANWSTAVTFGEHVDNPVRIELHTRIYEHLPRHEIDITKQAFPKEARDGINGYPSNGALMRHLLLHTAGNLRGNGLRFIQLHDIASVAVRLDARDWEELIVQDADAGRLWWALPPLRLASIHFPGTIPEPVLQQFERSSRRCLRWTSRHYSLIDVSLSAARIRAFPGLSWSGSLAEGWAVIAERLVPGPEVRASRRLATTMAPYSGSSWTHASQFSRILRWVLRQPPASAAMYSIRQALAYRPQEASWSPSNKAAV